jgi:cell surface protein SprA
MYRPDHKAFRLLLLCLMLGSMSAFAQETGDTSKTKPRYPLQDKQDPAEEPGGMVPMGNPENIESDVQYNVDENRYEFNEKIGTRDYRPPSYMDFDDYIEQQRKNSISDYWKEKSFSDSEYKKEEGELKPKLDVESETFDRIFGGNTIDIKPSGSAELRFGLRTSRNDNPVIPERQRRITTFQYDQSMQLNVLGNVGDKVKVTMNYNTDATFDFDNQVKLDYTGYEDDILQDIEIGNVALPLNSSLITGSTSLIGVKTKLKFGKLNVTTVFSQQKGKKSQIRTEGGAQISEFEVRADSYEPFRHYFLSHFFRDQYEAAVSRPPMYNTGVVVTRVEVWVTNTRANPENPRDIIAFQDLGTTNESQIFNPGFVDVTANPGSPADNAANTLYNTMLLNFGAERDIIQAANILDGTLSLDSRLDYERVEFARKLDPSEYDLNAQLGYISLRQQIQSNQVLAVAYEYTYRGQVYKVGEFSNEIAAPRPVFLKLLKSVEKNTRIPMWDLMMKNIYNIGAYQVQQDGFELDIWYLDQNLGVDINYIPEEIYNKQSLVQLLGLDKLNRNQKNFPDGMFDYLQDFTIIPQNGRVILPWLEPFGDGIRQVIDDPIIAEKYAFDSLYTRTPTEAKVMFPSKNRFSIKGEYKSTSSNEISLNAINVPEGSVTVTAGGRVLTENVDYQVDYKLGRVRIINQGLVDSNTPIDVSLESNELFAQQQRNMVGARFDYKVNRDLLVGGTLLRLSEKPITQKIDFGNEPVTNMIWGVDGSYKADVPFLTKMIDKLPFIETKEKSSIKVSGEFAHLVPGHSRAIGRQGNSFIDDFEGSQSFIDMKSIVNWRLAATPQGQRSFFPEGEDFNSLTAGYNRALINWRVVDPLFYQGSAPEHIRNDPEMLDDHRMRIIYQQEVFPNRSNDPFTQNNISVLDVSFYPRERGPYNYNVEDLEEDGGLADPTEKWGGITRRVDQNDFEAANIEFLQFWLMDPFNEDADPDGNHNGGELYINLGNISEDVMYDGQVLYEQDLPNNQAEAEQLPEDISAWGRVTRGVPLSPGFDNDPSTRVWQDAGMDGLVDDQEREFFSDYIDAVKVKHGVNSQAYLSAQGDPSNDNYNYYRDDDYDELQLNILDRYKEYNGTEGNSPTREQYEQLNAQGFPTSATTQPDKEDLNADNVVNNVEAYYQYRVKITRNDLNPANVGRNFITNVIRHDEEASDGTIKSVNWYQIKIPLKGEDRQRIGAITDFRSIRFMRMFLTGFDEEVHMRFARLEFIRGEWRRFQEELDDNSEGFGKDDKTIFNIRAVSIEENGTKQPVNYVLPPGVLRETNINTANLQQINEQAMSIEVCDLQDGYAEAAYRNTFYDMRLFTRLKMWVHAEELPGGPPLEDGDLNIFVRLGTDFTDNYYEYELPLNVTPPDFYLKDFESDRYEVWPLENQVSIPLGELRQLKVERDRELSENPSALLKRKRYGGRVGLGNAYVVGSPNLGEVKVIMIGVRNPRWDVDSTGSDDALPKCAEIWVNEMRLNDFDDRQGWAALGRVNAKLADLAMLSLAGSISTPGFGSLEQKINERQKETKKNFDASGTIQLGKFFPEKAGIQLPMYVGYSEDIRDPQFSPLAEDVPFEDYVQAWDTRQERDSVKKAIQDKTIRKSINFTNVKKVRKKSPGKSGGGGDKAAASKPAKRMPYDIENFTFNYSYSEILERDFETEYDVTRTYKGGFNYAYSLNPKIIKPFSKVKALRQPNYLRLVRETNFYPLPRTFTFQTNMDRQYQERQIRNNNPGIRADLPSFYNKTWTWNRVYSLKWDLTKNLKYDFNATNQSLVDELDGQVNRNSEEVNYDEWKESVWNSIGQFGKTLNYRHTSNFSYKIPMEMIPPFDFISSNVRYSATYNWIRQPLAFEDNDTLNIGNTIQNSGNFTWNANLNMRTLYNKSDYLKKVQRKARQNSARTKREKERKKAAKSDDADEKDGKAEDKKATDKSQKFTLADRFFNLLMSVQNGSVTYSQNRGILLPGYQEGTSVMGLNPDLSAPGLGFVLGKQNRFGPNEQDFPEYAADQGWLVRSQDLNLPATYTYSTNLNMRMTVQPFKDFRITFSADRRFSESTNEYFRWVPDSLDPSNGFYEGQSPVVTGNFSSSMATWRTSFVPLDDEKSSATFRQFLANRAIISERLGEANGQSDGEHANDEGFSEGYGQGNIDVLIPAFLAAYTGTSARWVNLNPFDVIPKFNWRITYNGLSKIEWFKKRFKKISINHTYNSNMTIGGYVNNQRYIDDDGDGFPDIGYGFDLDSNFIPQNQYQNISIVESFSPLLMVDMTFNNSLLAKMEFKRSRTLTLNPANNQLMETRSIEYILGTGYTFKNVPFPIEFKPGQKIKSDFKMRADFSIRDNATIVHRIIEDEHETTAGMYVFSIKITGDYKINKQLTLRAFYDRILNRPKMSNTFLNANANFGVALRFTLS